MVPSSQARDEPRPATASGVGRMNGGKPPTTTTACQTSDEDGQRRRPTHGEPGRCGLRAAPSRGAARISAAVPAATAGVERVERPRPRRRRSGSSATTRPGRGDMTTTRSATRIASGMLWVTITIVVGGALAELEQLEVEAFAGQRVERAERLVEEQHLGLERERPGERHALARSPPDIWTGRASSAAPSRPTSSARSSEARGADVRRDQPASSSGYVMLSAPVRHGSSRGSWNTRPIRGSGPVIGLAVERDAARGSGASRPGDDPQERRLAAAVRPDDRDDLAPRRSSRSRPSSATCGSAPSPGRET